MKTLILILLILSAWLGYKTYTLSGQNTRLELKLEESQASLKKTEASLVNIQSQLEIAEKKLAEESAAASQGDTQYQVFKKEYVEGSLVDSGEKAPDTGRAVMKRLPPHWRLYLVGVQTKREYPALEVQETAYSHFIQGGIYTRLELNSAKR